MADLDVFAAWAQIAGTVAIALAILFALVQLREFRQQRQQTAALTFLQSLQDPEQFQQVQRVMDLPDDASPEEIAERGPEMRRAIIKVYVTFESLGYMVFRRMIPLNVADEFAGGAARITWQKLRKFVAAERASGGPNAYEWFEWLVDRMNEHPVPGKKAGAYASYRAWQP